MRKEKESGLLNLYNFFMEKIITFLICIYRFYLLKSQKIRNKIIRFKVRSIPFGYFGKHVMFDLPSTITSPERVFLHDYTSIHKNNIIYNYKGRFVMKKYSAASVNLTVVTGNHIPTVGIPLYYLVSSHINDKEKDIIVEEDVWIGANVTLISGAHIGRGAVVGACCLVRSDIPPYAIAVGVPAKVVGVKFSKEQIIEHEKKLYKPEERFSEKELDDLFSTKYCNLKVLGTSYISDSDKIKCSKILEQINISE